MQKFYDVIEVSRVPPHTVKRMAGWKIDSSASILIALMNKRLGGPDKVFLMVPAESYATGDEYKERLPTMPGLSIFTDRPTGMKCGTLLADAAPPEPDLQKIIDANDLDRLAVISEDGKPLMPTINCGTMKPRHFY